MPSVYGAGFANLSLAYLPFANLLFHKPDFLNLKYTQK